MEEMSSFLSVGHSNCPWKKFEKLIGLAGVTAVADVRSNPYSRFQHFCQPALRARLNHLGISYVSLGEELGGQPSGGATPDYEAMAISPQFRAGVERVEALAPRCRLALMCSEHEPLTCHRCLLVGRRLVERGHRVEHILRDGRIEDHSQTEDRLLAITAHAGADLLAPRAERLAAAYRAQAARLHRPVKKASTKPVGLT